MCKNDFLKLILVLAKYPTYCTIWYHWILTVERLDTISVNLLFHAWPFWSTVSNTETKVSHVDIYSEHQRSWFVLIRYNLPLSNDHTICVFSIWGHNQACQALIVCVSMQSDIFLEQSHFMILSLWCILVSAFLVMGKVLLT